MLDYETILMSKVYTASGMVHTVVCSDCDDAMQYWSCEDIVRIIIIGKMEFEIFQL